ncbi:cytochrome P450 [Favolaschia claudopus]|uniref:Cytochrome P450 n=1 Tax=Favolaschia claudopus TaxID=2862362 RepID=A0AAW0CHX5_9AGAR
MTSPVLLPVGLTVLFYVLYHALPILYREFAKSIRRMPGPQSHSWLFGNFKEMMANANLMNRWREEFGATFRFRGLFSISELHTSDIKAINHIFSKSAVYRRAPSARESSRGLSGDGILSVEEEDHKRFNPAFTIAQMRVITEIFMEKATQLSDIWKAQLGEDGSTHIDVLSWIRLMTLDTIGKAGFDYDFQALVPDKKPNELNEVLLQIFHSPASSRYATFRQLQSLVPILKLIPLPGTSLFLAARSKMLTIGYQILARSKADIEASNKDKNMGGQRDLLSTLLRANLSPDVPVNQRLNDAELVSQIPTFFVAGNETTSLAASWALHALSVNTAAQKELREELFTISTDNPTMDELNSLPYLERVVRETLRLYSPITFRHRMAMEEDVLPLSKPYIDKNGETQVSVVIPKGQLIHIPVLAINTDAEIWGLDAKEWKPERWENIPKDASNIPTVWANLMTFFAGPHNCVGFRFAVLEVKALLFAVVRAFEIEKAVPEGGIRPAALLQRPFVVAEGGRKSSLPLVLRAYAESEGI